jgi:uncharacterized protein
MTDSTPLTCEEWNVEHADRPVFERIDAEMGAWLDGDSSGHDAHHVWRVFATATEIAAAEGADVGVVGAAALVHDVHRAMDGTEFVHPEASLPEVRAVLERAGFPEAKIPEVLHCVAVHDEYEYRGDDVGAETLEAEILRDADNLDAMGAVGVARNFAFTGDYGNPLWDPAGEEYSGLYHFRDKLLELRDEMHTEAAREIAADRHEFLEAFVDRFEREWYGDA